MIIGKDVGGFLKNFFSNGASQAFLLEGETDELEDLLMRYLLCETKSFCKKCYSCESESLLDVRRYEDDTLKIEDAREVQWNAGQTRLMRANVFIIKNKHIAPDAQATLLKTLEEPHPGTYFILSSVPQAALSRPLLSRLTIFKRLAEEAEKVSGFKFSLADVQGLKQERGEAEEILNKLEVWAEDKIRNTPPERLEPYAVFVEDLYEARRRFFEKTYPPKMLLEHLAISKYYIDS